MTHDRQLIRDAAKQMLIGQGPWENRVYTNRMRSLSARPNIRSDRNQLPALVIYTRKEVAEIYNVAPREYKCAVELWVEIIADSADEIDDILDGMAAIVERIFGRDATIGDTANDCVYAGSDMTIVEDKVERPIGAVLMEFEATYFRLAPDGPSDDGTDEGFNATLPDLNESRIEYSLSNQQENPADRASTRIEGLNE